MFERFKFGSYRINEESELANSKKTKSNKTLTVLVKFSDNTNVKFGIDVSKKNFSHSHPHIKITHRRFPEALSHVIR